MLLLQTEYLRQNPFTDPQDTIDELEREAERLRAELDRARRANPEADTCVWTRNERNEWITACGDYGIDPVREGLPCEKCRRPVKIEQAGKAEGSGK